VAASGSYARREHPRSVPDALDESYRKMVAEQRARNAEQEASGAAAPPTNAPTVKARATTGPSTRRQFDHPGTMESMVPIWGSGREALADLEDRNYLGAAVNAGLAASDVVVAKAVVGGLAKGGLKTAGPWAWRQFEEGQAKGMRPWLGEKGFLKPNQPGHHWWLEQKGSAPDWLRNQPPFIKGMKDAAQHGRVHGPYTVDGVKLPQFNALERLWHGTPDWLKAGYVSSAGHAGEAAGRAGADPQSLARPRQ
jgi:hypothetical protein